MDFTRFEKAYNACPYRLCDRHPDGLLVAMQVNANIPRAVGPSLLEVRKAAIHVLQKMKRPVTPENLAKFGIKDSPITDTRLRCAIWDLYSGKLVLAPADTIALVWLHNGHEMGLLRERYDYQPEEHTIIGSPLQSEFTYTWERNSWPDRKLLSSCQITMPTGWPTTLIVSPNSDLAVFQWMDQGESGLEFISISEPGDHQIMRTKLPILEKVTDLCFRPNGNGFPIGSNLVSPPSFSPDGRYIVFTWQNSWDWWTDATESDNTSYFSLKKGIRQVGFVEIIDWEQRHVREIAITITLPQNGELATSNNKAVAANLINSSPTFIDHEHFTLSLPTEEVKIYNVHEDDLTARLIQNTSQTVKSREKTVIERIKK